MAYTLSQTLPAIAASQQGASVACVGNVLVVGAEGALSDTPAYGAIEIYNLIAGVWTLQQTIYPADGAGEMNFGTSVAFDGTTIAVGAPRISIPGNGKVYLYRLSGGTWTQYQEIPSPSGSVAGGTDAFGNSVQILGGTLIVGAPFGNSAGVQTGVVYYYANTGASYVQQQVFKGSDSVAADGFGTQVSALGSWLIVRTGVNNADAGSYFFQLSGTYTQAQKLASGNPAVSWSFLASSTTAYLGIGNPGGLGSVDIVKLIAGVWTVQTSVQSGFADDGFGACIVGTDTDVFIGAPVGGDVFWFQDQQGSWNQLQELTVPNNATFGQAIGITGPWLIIGAPSSSPGLRAGRMGASAGGAAYAFIGGGLSFVNITLGLKGMKVYPA